jgi:excisionase family DNA binding protein
MTQETSTATDGRNAGQTSAASGTALLDVQQVGKFLNCSPRTVYRLADAGKMPAPVRLGALVRWSRASVEAWIAAGCPSCKKAGRP